MLHTLPQAGCGRLQLERRQRLPRASACRSRSAAAAMADDNKGVDGSEPPLKVRVMVAQARASVLWQRLTSTRRVNACLPISFFFILHVLYGWR